MAYYPGVLIPDKLCSHLEQYAHVPTMVALPQLKYQQPNGKMMGVTLVGLPTSAACQINDGLKIHPGLCHTQPREH